MNHYILCGLCLWSSATCALAAERPDPVPLAAKVDQHLATHWERAKVQPAAAAEERVLLRRLYLDLVGRIPTVAETHAFFDDADSDKAARLTDRLIASGGHAQHFATVWRRVWLPQADTPEFANLTEDFENWIAVRLRDNTPYDRLVHELLTATRTQGRVRGASGEPGDRVTPAGFLAASQFKPENLAANTTRAFLGLNLDCAQCHNHPFSRWTRDQFWQTAAFFVTPKPTGETMLVKLEIGIPDTMRNVSPALLDTQTLTWPEKLEADTGRRVLADWVTAKANPYFARNAVNRVWAQLFGTGLVEPLDDLSEDNPPSHPELLAELAEAFTQSGFDLQYLTRALVRTRAYRLSTLLPEEAADDDPRLFARMPVRGLTGEQLYDSSRVAAGLPVERRDLLAARATDQRQRFAARMLVARPVEAERSIVQALSLMNGSLTSELTTPASSPTLSAAIESPFLNSQAKVEMLYFSALNRKPSAQESSRLVNYVESGGADRSAAQALADIFWTLLNSSEFNTNH